jgi:hypothetical protein
MGIQKVKSFLEVMSGVFFTLQFTGNVNALAAITADDLHRVQ